MLTHGEKFLK